MVQWSFYSTVYTPLSGAPQSPICGVTGRKTGRDAPCNFAEWVAHSAGHSEAKVFCRVGHLWECTVYFERIAYLGGVEDLGQHRRSHQLCSH